MIINDNLNVIGKRILIVGNRWQKNLWDELILLGTIKLLNKEHKKIYIAANGKLWLNWFFHQFNDIGKFKFISEIPKGIRSLITFLLTGKFKDLFRYFHIDSVIIWWWEILTEENHSSYRYWIISILPCLIKKVFMHVDIYIMWWVQVPKKRINRFLFNYLLKRTTKVFARDMDSVKELKNHWYDNVEWFMDTSYFAYDWKDIKKEEEWEDKKPYIIVNLNKNWAHFLEDIVKDIKGYLVKWYKVYFVPIAKWLWWEYMDIKYYYKIKNALAEFETLNLWNFLILDWEYKFEKFAQKLIWAEMVISSRLHLFLISEFMWVSTQVYPYQKKILKMKKVVEELVH